MYLSRYEVDRGKYFQPRLSSSALETIQLGKSFGNPDPTIWKPCFNHVDPLEALLKKGRKPATKVWEFYSKSTKGLLNKKCQKNMHQQYENRAPELRELAPKLV